MKYTFVFAVTLFALSRYWLHYTAMESQRKALHDAWDRLHELSLMNTTDCELHSKYHCESATSSNTIHCSNDKMEFRLPDIQMTLHELSVLCASDLRLSTHEFD